MRDEIILKNLGLIYKVMKDLNCTYDNEESKEEYYFAGLIGLIKAAETYDSTKGKSGYLYRAIKGRIISVFKKHTSSKKNMLKDISLSIPIFDGELIELIEDKKDFEKDFINKDMINYGLNKMRNRTDAEIIKKHFLENKKIKEIAKEYGVTSTMIGIRVKNGLQALKIILERDYK